jgi:PAS domain S-box-containing protein
MDRLTIPGKLYSREADIAALLESFERISSGHGQVLLVPGASGVGKTALAQELRQPIRGRNGFFIRGKFDQYQQAIPCVAFRQALAELCRELQSGEAPQRARFKDDILRSMGDLGQVLVDLVPEYEAFLGAQPPLEGISPREARHRFAEVFRNLLKAVCRPEHPLVLFIDDWQWADAASCDLLKQMQVGITLRYLLVIVSYRDNEVTDDHPLTAALDDLRRQTVPLQVLRVDTIRLSDVVEMLADTLKPTSSDVAGLAAIIHGKTGGNPFFARSFLGFLHELGLIGFDRSRNAWRWCLADIAGADLPRSVVELFTLKLRRLDPDSQTLFSLAACLGNHFDLETLSIISGHPAAACRALLLADRAGDLLLPQDGGGERSPAAGSGAPQFFAFQHDQIQQAAYTLMTQAELPATLLRIGRLWLASLDAAQLSERLFEVVGHLNAGRHLIESSAEQVRVLELNLAAGRKAYAATAYRAARQFYRAANSFLETPGFAEQLWRDHHPVALQLFRERAECEFLEGNRAEAEHCIQQAVARAETAIERAAALRILIVHDTLLARYPEAIAAGRQALAALGVSLPEGDYEAARDAEIAQVRQDLGSRAIATLVELPVMSHPEMLMAASILITMGPPCYRSHQRLWGVIVPKVVNLTLRYGNIPQVGYSHTAFGGLLAWVDDDYASAREFGELATRLMTGTFTAPSHQSVFYLMIGSSIRHWFKHLRYGTQDYRDAYEVGLRSNNLQYAAYAFGHDMYCRFYQGAPLAGLIQETQRSLEFSQTRLNQWACDLLEGGLSLFGALSGASPAAAGTPAWSEADFLQRVEDHHNLQVTCIYKVLKTFALLLADDAAAALALSDEAEPLIYTVGTQGLLPWPEHVFARLLILTTLYPEAEGAQQASWRAELERMLGKLRLWANNCPENFEHKYLLAAAELARIDGRPAEAMLLYDQAVAAAQAGDFLQWEGMANERAYRFWLADGNERLAHVYWQQAYVCYDQWGAGAKVSSMETAYRADLAPNLAAGAARGEAPEPLEAERRQILVEGQIQHLRNHSFRLQQNTLQTASATQVEELAAAMQRVRLEIAERKRIAEALSRSEERHRNVSAQLEAIIDHLPCLIFFKDKMNNFIHVNTYLAQAQGMSKGEMEGRNLAELYTPEAADRYYQDDLAVIKSGVAALNVEESWSTPAGVKWVSTSKIPFVDASGEIVGVIGMSMDITERKRAEEEKANLEGQLQQAQKMESVGRLAGGVAHEFNNQLMGIMNYVELCRDELPPTHLIRSYLDEIFSSARHSADITRQLLAFARKQSIAPKVLDLNEALSGTLTMMRHLLGADIELAWLPGTNLYPVTVDPGQIDQILANLCDNARDAIKGVGRVTIATTNVSLDAAYCARREGLVPGAHVRLAVSDNGCGMDKEVLGHLFEPFFTTQPQGRGTGLGLATVYGIVQQNHGHLDVRSEPGQGTTFSIYLPSAAGAPGAPAAATAPVERPRGTETILLVDDEKSIRVTTQRFLEALGYTVLAAAEPEEALRLASQHAGEIQLLISDVLMPGMSGPDLANRLHESRAGMKSLFMSGYSAEGVSIY